MMITTTDKEAVIIKKPWGRQYRFLFFFTLIAGLILPLISMLNLVYLCFSRDFGDYDSQFYSLCDAYRMIPIIFAVVALAGIALLSVRYPFRACAVPLLFAIAGMLVTETYYPFLVFYSKLRYDLPFGHMSIPSGYSYYQGGFWALVTPAIVYLLGLLMKRLLRGKITGVVFTLLSFTVLKVLLNGAGTIVNFILYGDNGYMSRWFVPSLIDAAEALIVMSLAATVILLIFRFKIPTDDPTQRERRDEEEEPEDDDYDDR